MPVLTFLNHLLNFVAPALFMACVLTGVARVVWHKQTPLLSWGEQWMVQTLLGVVVLGVGLVVWGRDGRMATYGALAVLMATSQWLMVRGWQVAAAGASKKGG